jgi:hypothetical protein
LRVSWGCVVLVNACAVPTPIVVKTRTMLSEQVISRVPRRIS